MNLRNVLSAYSKLRQLTDDESALLETLRGLNDTERELLVESLQPEKVTSKKPTTERKIEHCAVCNWTKRAALHKDTTRDDYHEFVGGGGSAVKSEKKSKRAQSLSGAIQRAGKGRVDDDDSNDEDEYERCQYQRDGRTCFLLPDHNVHHLQSAMNYHPFVSFASLAEGQSSVDGGSSAPASDTRKAAPPSTAGNGETGSPNASSTIPSSEDETVSAGSVAQEASGRG